MQKSEMRIVGGVFVLLLCVLVVPAQAALTISASSSSAYLGDNITFFGTNTETTESYLFLVGPGLPSQGAQIHSIDPASNAVVDQNSGTFAAAVVTPATTWSWTWVTRGVILDAGTYTIYVLTDPRDRNNLGSTTYGTYSLILKKPFVSVKAAGDQHYYFGELMKFSGNNTLTPTTYLFMTGPGLPAQGARLNANPAGSPVTNNSGSTFSQATVNGDTSWTYYWQTEEKVALDAGTYTVFAAAVPIDRNNLVSGFYSAVDIQLDKPFISATSDKSVGPAGTVFHLTGTKEGGISPGHYVNIFITNASSGGSLPADGVRLDDLTVKSITGKNATFTRATVLGDNSWSYTWDTSAISGGSLLPGSSYVIYMSMYPQNKTDATDYTKIGLGIEGPVTASYTISTTSGQVPLTVQVTDTSTGVTTGILWEWGDGSTTTSFPEATVTHTYTSEGVFFPQLTASNSISSNVKVFDPPISVSVVPFTDIYQAKAYNAILNDPAILGGSTAGKTVSAYDGTFFSASPVKTWSDEPARNLILPSTPGYLFFIDDYPEANWEHPCRYAFVEDSVDLHHGNTVHPYVYDRWSPLIDVELGYIAGDQPDLAGANALDGSSGADIGTTIEGGTTVACSPDCTHNYALLLSGGYNEKSNYARYYNDILSMYNVLNKTYHYPMNHIWVLMSDGGAAGLDQHYKDVGTTPTYINSDMTPFALSKTGAATKTVLTSTLTDINSKLTLDDSLFIFTTNHGGNTTDPASKEVTFYLWNGESIKDSEFVSMLPTTPKTITMMMEQCFGGGFIDNFAVTSGTQKRVITTAASWNEYSWGNAFSMAWMTGIDNPVNSDTTGDKRTSVNEAYSFAKANDKYATMIPAKENPQFSVNNAAGSETLFVSGCSAVHTIKVTSPGAYTWMTGTTHSVSWVPVGIAAGKVVNIELWKGSGTTAAKVSDIATGIDAASGLYDHWTIPVTLAAGTNYWVKIYQADDTAINGRSSGNLIIKAGSGTNLGTLKVLTTLSGSAVSGATVMVYERPLNSIPAPSPLFSGITPLTKSTQDGTKIVRVSKDGYYADPLECGVPVPNGGTITHTVILTAMDANDVPPAGQIVIRSTPVQDARVIVDGESLEGRTTDVIIERAPGPHTISVEHEGYITPASKTVIIPPYTGGAMRVVYADFDLSPTNGNIPEFPSGFVSVIMIVGFLGTVCYIRNTRER
jgi:PKD repeat protein